MTCHSVQSELGEMASSGVVYEEPGAYWAIVGQLNSEMGHADLHCHKPFVWPEASPDLTVGVVLLPEPLVHLMGATCTKQERM